MSSTNYPSSFKVFNGLNDLQRHAENRKELVKFVYRYRLAMSFEEIKASEIKSTLKGYNVVLKLFLAFTAYEQLLKSADGLNVFSLRRLNENFIPEPALSIKLRKNKRLMDFLIQYTDKSALLGRLVSFRSGTSDDITSVAYAIRNVFAHGELTATGIGTKLKSDRDTLSELADSLLKYCDETFTKCVEKLR